MNGSTSAFKTLHLKVTEGCQTLNSHFLKLWEMFTLTKGVTYQIATGGWVSSMGELEVESFVGRL